MAEWTVGTTDTEIEEALRAVALEPEEPRIVEAAYESHLDIFVFKLNDGRRLVYPRENLQALQHSTPRQAANFVVGPYGTDIWWPDLDEGHYLPTLLEGKMGTAAWMAKIERREVAA